MVWKVSFPCFDSMIANTPASTINLNIYSQREGKENVYQITQHFTAKNSFRAFRDPSIWSQTYLNFRFPDLSALQIMDFLGFPHSSWQSRHNLCPSSVETFFLKIFDCLSVLNLSIYRNGQRLFVNFWWFTSPSVLNFKNALHVISNKTFWFAKQSHQTHHNHFNFVQKNSRQLVKRSQLSRQLRIDVEFLEKIFARVFTFNDLIQRRNFNGLKTCPKWTSSYKYLRFLCFGQICSRKDNAAVCYATQWRRKKKTKTAIYLELLVVAFSGSQVACRIILE